MGIIDSGVELGNPALLNRITWFKDYVEPSNTTPTDTVGHGTLMAQIIGGTANPDGPNGMYNYGGVAPQSSLYIARIAETGDGYQFNLASQAVADLNAQGVKLINNSYSVDLSITDPTNGQSVAATRYAQFSQVMGNGQLMVWAAGNNGNTEPNVEPGVPYYYPSLEHNWLAVVNVDVNASGQPTQLDPTSNQCGVAAGWCLAAAGATYLSPVPGTDFSTGYAYGTSNATAVVTGVAALVWQRFPFFTASNVQETLLGTATSGGNAAVFGYGMVNAAAAVNGPASLNWGVFDVNIPANESGTFSNYIAGAGSLQLDGSGSLTLSGGGLFGGIVQNGGTLTLTGSDTLDNDAQINGGTFVMGGYLAASQVTIAQGATMELMGSISGGVINNGTLDARLSTQPNPNLPIIQNNYTAASSATTIIQAGDALAVLGQANLNSSNLILYIPPGYQASANVLVLNATTLLGMFGTVTLNGGVYTTGTLSYNNNDVFAALTQSSVSSVAASSMTNIATTQQTAQHIQTALATVNPATPSKSSGGSSFAAAADAFYSVYSVPQAEASINSLSGQLLASSQALTFEQAGIVNRTVADRLVDLGDGNARQGAWFQGTGADGDIARSGYATGSYSGGGSVAGYDVRLADDFMLGVGLDWNHLGSSYSLEGGNNTSRSTGAMLYAKWLAGNAYVSGRIGEDWIHSDTSRWGVLGVMPAAISSSRNDQMTSAYLEAGYDVKSDAWTTTPFASLGDEHLDRGAINEQGAGGFGIAASSEDFNQSYAQLGTRLAYRWNWGAGQLSLKGYALYQRILGGRDLGFTAAYAGAPNATFELEGVNSPRSSAWVGAGLNAVINNHWSGFLNLDGQFASGGNKARTLSAGVRYQF
ncbi:autotransporter domain-containing protein [Dyella mobilis]|uniref:Autotransporter domain-containing protein n=1 Tax=Dyella mobilis TaxID=1849582 RepID=A0ABS2KEM4_9GAMM|nr:autotransporter domain-containing protein [Dyella mobilis]